MVADGPQWWHDGWIAMYTYTYIISRHTCIIYNIYVKYIQSCIYIYQPYIIYILYIIDIHVYIMPCLRALTPCCQYIRRYFNVAPTFIYANRSPSLDIRRTLRIHSSISSSVLSEIRCYRTHPQTHGKYTGTHVHLHVYVSVCVCLCVCLSVCLCVHLRVLGACVSFWPVEKQGIISMAHTTCIRHFGPL